MTTPQTSDGYTRTANELMEAECKACLTGNEWRVYNAVKRLTYGWNKKEDRIAYSLIVELTNLAKNRVFEAVQSLIKKAVLLSRPTGTHSPQFLGINKNFKAWQVSRSRGISRPSGTTHPAPAVQNYTAQGGPPKTVKTFKEKTLSPKALPSEAIELAKRLGRWIRERDPGNKSIADDKYTKTFQTWGDAIDKIHRIDGREWETIEAVIDWCQNDEFWQNNVLSGSKLRGQFSQLVLKMRQGSGPGPSAKKPNTNYNAAREARKRRETENNGVPRIGNDS